MICARYQTRPSHGSKNPWVVEDTSFGYAARVTGHHGFKRKAEFVLRQNFRVLITILNSHAS